MALKPNTLKIVECLKEASEPVLASEIAEELGLTIPQVTGSVNALAKKGYTARKAGKIKLENGETKEVKFIYLTDEGKADL